MHFDYDGKKMYFRGDKIYDNPNPIPNPRVDSSLPLWAIIALSVVGVMAIGVIVWYFRNQKKKTLAAGLAQYEQIERNH